MSKYSNEIVTERNNNIRKSQKILKNIRSDNILYPIIEQKAELIISPPNEKENCGDNKSKKNIIKQGYYAHHQRKLRKHIAKNLELPSPKINKSRIPHRRIYSVELSKRPLDPTAKIIALNKNAYLHRRYLINPIRDDICKGGQELIERGALPILKDRYNAKNQNGGRFNPVKMAIVAGGKYNVMPQWWG